MLKLDVNVTEESQSQQCGAWYDPNINSSITNNFQVERKTVDTLSAIYLATSILGAALVALALDPLHTFSDISESEDSNTRSLDLLMATCKQMTNPYQIYIIPLTMWSGFEQAFFGADFTAVIIKAYFSMKPAKKNFSLLGGKIKFELALQPSTASTAKIQIQFSRQGD